MKTLMILGGSFLQIPAILKAKEMNLKTVVVDYNPEAEGFKYADVRCEISTTDTVGIIKEAKKNKIDGIITLASDRPMLSVAKVVEELGLNGISVKSAEKATNKALMRKALKEKDVPIPEFYVVNTLSEYLNKTENLKVPFIVKPSDNSGSRGISLVKNSIDSESTYYYSRENSYSGEVLVEEYLIGDEVSVETMTIDGKTEILAITDKITTGPPYFVELGHSQPSLLSKNIIEEISKVTIDAIEALEIKTGPSHVEVKITSNGAKIIELGARMGGDFISTHLVPLSTGIDMMKGVIQLAIGEKYDLEQRYNKGSAIKYFESDHGKIIKIKGLVGAQNIKGVKKITFTKEIGDEIAEIKSSVDRIGYVISQGENANEALNICENVKDVINIEIERKNE